MSKGVGFGKLDGSALKIGLVYARWNKPLTSVLVCECKRALLDAGVRVENIIARDVPGSYELPFAAVQLIKKEKVDAVVCLGALIKGETMHFEYIAQAVSCGIMKVQLETGVPVIFGVLTCLNEQQARARSSGAKSHAYEWGLTAVEMGRLNKKSCTL